MTVLGLSPCLAEPRLLAAPSSVPRSSPVAAPGEPRVLRAEVTGTLFAKYLQYQTYRITTSELQELEGGFVFGPGHHISAMAALVFDETLRPCATFKTGDTRLSRALRGEPYVATSGIAGRWDKAGYSAAETVLAELSEEVGGEVIAGTFRRLGEHLSPTMPLESTEADEFFRAAVTITSTALGDGGRMEVRELIGPVFFSPLEAIAAMDDGRISDSARARAMFGRAWASIGFIPALDGYVWDHPELLARYDTLGLGPAEELRERLAPRPLPAPAAPGHTLKARISTVSVKSCLIVELSQDHEMVDARIEHAVDNHGRIEPLPPDFASQYFRTAYDRVKVAVYILDPGRGPLVKMTPQLRPALALAPGSVKAWRRDLADYRLSKTVTPSEWAELGRELGGTLYPLARTNAASSGQADLYYHYAALELQALPAEDADLFVPLSEAIRLCRTGHGDAQTEATLLRLADRLEWIPELAMTRSLALSVITGTAPLR